MLNLKKIAAEKAVEKYVKDGMTIGLGTGSTAYHAVCRIGELVRSGMKLKCVATSRQTEDLAKECGIAVVSLDDVCEVDVTIDGCDEVDPDMQLIKGLGGALLREKIVASASVREVIITDESKRVDVLGTRSPLPVEVMRFGHTVTRRAIEKQGCTAMLRMNGNDPFISDSGNYIYDCRFGKIDNPFFLETRLNVIPGVVENGLFLNTATSVLISSADGTVTEMGE